MQYFPFGETETAWLSAKDKTLGAAIAQIGPIQRGIHPDLFQALVNSIVGQQISTKAQITIWSRILERFEVTPSVFASIHLQELQSCGISMRKAEYIQDAARRIESGQLDLEALRELDDDSVCRELSSLRGVGVWTAEMLMIFSMCRPNILSFGDLAILRGLRMLYRHREITRERFERYRRRYAPYASTASLYLWEIASGRWGYTDPAPKQPQKKLANSRKKAALSEDHP